MDAIKNSPYQMAATAINANYRPVHNNDAGSASVVNVAGESIFHQSNLIPDIKFLESDWLNAD